MVGLILRERMCGLVLRERMCGLVQRERMFSLLLLARLLRLLDALAAANVDGVSLHQIDHRAHDTELRATLSGEAVTAAWLARLRALPGVETVSVREMKRSTSGAVRAGERPREPLQVTAQLAWAGTLAGEVPMRGHAGAQRERSGK